MKKMKNKTTMLLAGGLAVVLILFTAAAIYFGMIVKDRSGSQLPEETEKPVMVEQGGQEKPQETQGLDAVEVDLVNAMVYRFDELDFQFAIAKIRVKAEEPINISLEHFATSEGVKLNDIYSWIRMVYISANRMSGLNWCPRKTATSPISLYQLRIKRRRRQRLTLISAITRQSS